MHVAMVVRTRLSNGSKDEIDLVACIFLRRTRCVDGCVDVIVGVYSSIPVW